MNKTCTKCKQEKPMDLVHFGPNRRASSGFHYVCRACCTAYRREWARRPENKDYDKKYGFKRYAKDSAPYLNACLKKAHGISWEQYSEILADQGGVCAICKEPPGKMRLAVDHCHQTGVIRGLLCGPCNVGIGNLRENEDVFLSAIQYLRKVPVRVLISRQFKLEHGAAETASLQKG